MRLERNAILFLTLVVPFLLVLFIIASVYIPRIFSRPSHDFLYVVSSPSYVDDGYKVVNQSVKKTIVDPEDQYNSRFGDAPVSIDLYVYHSATGKSQKVMYEDAIRMVLNDNPKSPDNYEIVSGTSPSSPLELFGYSGYGDVYLKGKYASYKVNYQGGGTYKTQFRFLGWITSK